MADFLIVVLVVGGCLLAYVAIGDLFDRYFGSRTADEVHRRWRRGARSGRPAAGRDDRGDEGRSSG